MREACVTPDRRLLVEISSDCRILSPELCIDHWWRGHHDAIPDLLADVLPRSSDDRAPAAHRTKGQTVRLQAAVIASEHHREGAGMLCEERPDFRLVVQHDEVTPAIEPQAAAPIVEPEHANR